MPQTNLARAKERAKTLGVEIKPSTRKNKKLDVFKQGEKVASIGDKLLRLLATRRRGA